MVDDVINGVPVLRVLGPDAVEQIHEVSVEVREPAGLAVGVELPEGLFALEEPPVVPIELTCLQPGRLLGPHFKEKYPRGPEVSLLAGIWIARDQLGTHVALCPDIGE